MIENYQNNQVNKLLTKEKQWGYIWTKIKRKQETYQWWRYNWREYSKPWARKPEIWRIIKKTKSCKFILKKKIEVERPKFKFTKSSIDYGSEYKKKAQELIKEQNSPTFGNTTNKNTNFLPSVDKVNFFNNLF